MLRTLNCSTLSHKYLATTNPLNFIEGKTFLLINTLVINTTECQNLFQPQYKKKRLYWLP